MTPNEKALPPLTLNAWSRWDYFRDDLDSMAPSTVLELGPGEGAMACRVAHRATYCGIELSERTRALTEARLERQGTPGLLLESTTNLGPDQSFDMVCAFEVLEHIEDDRGALAEWSNLVAPGGHLVLSVPANPARMGASDRLAGHFRRYSEEDLREKMAEAGLSAITIRHLGFPIAYAAEAVRNLVAARRLRVMRRDHTPTVEELTEASSSLLQPSQSMGTAFRVASAPGRFLQRRFPGAGTGIYATARRES